MRVLIVCNSRCGSTNLMKSISSYYEIPYLFEPFTKQKEIPMYGDVVVKSLINHSTVSNYIELSKHFDKVILLSRRDIIGMSESLYWVSKTWEKNGYKKDGEYHLSEYEFNEGIDVTEKDLYNKVVDRINMLKSLSNELNIPIDYYEDIFYKDKKLIDTEIGLDLKYLDNSLKLRK